MQLAPVVEKIEHLAREHSSGQLPALRTKLKGLDRTERRIFFYVSDVKPSGENWSYAFHRGGRREMQFNVGLEDGGKALRYGVGFSFQRSQRLTDLNDLRSSLLRFNRFVKRNPAYLSRFSMWSYDGGRGRSDRLPVTPIPSELFRWGVFVFVGSIQPARERYLDYGRILDDLDWLMPVYKHVEGKGSTFPVRQTKAGFVFQPGCFIQTFTANATYQARTAEIDLLHKRIQGELFRHLASVHGARNVRAEMPNSRKSVDLAVNTSAGLWYYEVKTSLSVRDCIRQSLGQLLEYSY